MKSPQELLNVPRSAFRVPRSNEFLSSKLNPSQRNPRTITPAQKAALKKSLAEFGDLGGIVRNVRSDQLVGGNQRIDAFRADASAKVVVTEKFKTPDRCGTVGVGHIETNGTRYSYREVDWPAHKEAAANLAANQHGGEFDLPQVADILKELDGKIDLDLTGFPEMDLSEMLGKEKATPDDEGINYEPQFGVIVICKTEADQETAYKKLSKLGYDCKVVVT